jgi:hypothetical protein
MMPEHFIQPSSVARIALLSTCTAIALSGCGATTLDAEPTGTTSAEILDGTFESDSAFPWVVRTAANFSCHGVLIAPRWVLTAAHCLYQTFGGVDVFYSRTDPTTGQMTGGSMQTDPGSTFIHPQYDQFTTLNDIGLIHLPREFPADPLLRPAALPALPPIAGQVGVMASGNGQPNAVPPGKDAVLRGRVALGGAGQLSVFPQNASACAGDSGSGFITAGAGKNFVTGIAILSSDPDCIRPPGTELIVTEVWAYLDWIASTTSGVRPPPAPPASDLLWRYVGPSGQTSHGQLAIWRDGATTTAPSYPAIVDDAWKIAATGDFDGDGATDIVWRYIGPSGSTLRGQIAIWYGSSSDRAAYPAHVVEDTWQIKGVGDFDHDGRSDLLWQDTSGQVALWYGANPATSLLSGTQSATWQVAGVGDFDGDGASDILWKQTTGTSGLGTLEIWFSGTAARTARPPLTSDQLAYASSHAVQGIGDFDGEGTSDVLWRGSDGAVSIWFFAAAMVRATTPPRPGDPSWTIERLGDYNGDGRTDIYWRYFGADDPFGSHHGQLAIWYDGDNTIGPSYPGLVADDGWQIALTPGLHDPSPFPMSDVLWRYAGPSGANPHGQLAIWWNGGTGKLTGYPGIASDDGWTIVTTGDFDGDGQAEILWRYVGPSGPTVHGQLAVWYDANTSRQAFPAVVADDGMQVKGVGDFNHDGRTDLLWQNAAGQVTIWYGGDPATAAIVGTQGSTWQVAGTGDLDGDGFADLLWKSTGGTPAAGTLEIWFNGSNSRTRRPMLTAAQLSYAASHAVQAVADFQGDGTSDVLWRGSDGSISTWSFVSGNVNATTAPRAVDPGWTIQRIGDFDGDGRSDIYWRYIGPGGQTNHGQLAIWWSGDDAIAPTYPGLVTDDSWQIAGTGSF